jgi:hypothetical protein
VDVIPSPIIEPVSPTIVEEQEPVTEKMDVDRRDEEQNPTQQLGLGAPQQLNGEDDEAYIIR